MATNESVLAKTEEAYDEARALNGLQPIAEVLQAKDMEIDAKNDEIDALNTKVDQTLQLVDDIIAKDQATDAQEAADLKAARDKLAQ